MPAALLALCALSSLLSCSLSPLSLSTVSYRTLPSPLLSPFLPRVRASPPALCASREEEKGVDEERGDEPLGEARVFRRRRGSFQPYKPKDARDSLLFSVTLMTPPERGLGTFRLDPNTGCGDIIQLADTGQAYLIKSVAYKYAFSHGAYRMVAKSVKVKEAARDSVEKWMARMLPDQSGPKDAPERD
eukprot:scaffold37056_cov36-Tisochrysis_lutea.AAC.1